MFSGCCRLLQQEQRLIDVSADWIVNLWNEGALTANSFSVAMDREDITQLRDYLRTVLKG